MRGQCRWGLGTEGSAFGMRAVVHRGVVSRSFAPEQSYKTLCHSFFFHSLVLLRRPSYSAHGSSAHVAETALTAVSGR